MAQYKTNEATRYLVEQKGWRDEDGRLFKDGSIYFLGNLQEILDNIPLERIPLVLAALPSSDFTTISSLVGAEHYVYRLPNDTSYQTQVAIPYLEARLHTEGEPVGSGASGRMDKVLSRNGWYRSKDGWAKKQTDLYYLAPLLRITLDQIPVDNIPRILASMPAKDVLDKTLSTYLFPGSIRYQEEIAIPYLSLRLEHGL